LNRNVSSEVSKRETPATGGHRQVIVFVRGEKGLRRESVDLNREPFDRKIGGLRRDHAGGQSGN
jgi:hypothetical protein